MDSLGSTVTLQTVELDLLKWMLGHYGLSDCTALLDSVVVRGREHTGVGRFVELTMPELLFVRLNSVTTDRFLDGPTIDSSQFAHGAGSLVFLDAFDECCLEFAAYADDFPVNLTHYEFSEPPTLQGVTDNLGVAPE